MALTRAFLKGMNLTDEQVGAIIEAHTETVDALKSQRDAFKADAEKLTDVQKELNNLKAAGDGGYKEKYEAEKTAHEALKTQIANEKTQAEKVAAVKAYYESKNIKDKNLSIAMRGTKIDELELADGKLKDTTALDELISGDYASLVSVDGKEGASTPNPPAGTGSGGMSKADIMAIKDRAERRAAIAEHINLFENKEN